MAKHTLRQALADVACVLTGHRFVVWARTCEPTERHPHLGAWTRCARCGHERDWRVGGGSLDERVLDLVHGVVRPLRDVQAIARGERAHELPKPLAGAIPPKHPTPPLRPMRRRSSEGRGSSRRSPRAPTPRDHDPRDR
ncbi:hypothetical protein [Sandaracinus amylolyticus]|uniref:hypothetical protein n=1 Tax=Sandaracinus amylolyticus TaxID=927083 RepID=UPI001F178C56|nr:hypothetical protein [Sandaracinus amylolyticus]UJR80122.1 Hypothetical protein I5071_21660 [Sandaracinus amylolyticus]